MTPPFLVDQRVVILRDAGRLLTADVPRLVDVVSNPLPTTVLIVVGGGGTVPAPLVRAITAAGQEHLSSLRRVGASVFDVLIEKLTSAEAASLRAALPSFGRMLELADDDLA